MAIVLNTIYPPQVATFMPSFRYDQSATIWFDISHYNDDMISKIKYIHVSMVDQRNNQNVFMGLNGSNVVYPQYYPIAFNKNNMYDSTKKLYKITIPPQVLKTSPYYNAGQYYKVQLRFDMTGASGFPAYNSAFSNPTSFFYWNSATNNKANALQLASYTNYNQDNFSEWSTGTLIKPILIPVAELHFDGKSVADNPDYVVIGESLVSRNTNDKRSSENIVFEYLSNVANENFVIDLYGVLPSTDSTIVGNITFERALNDEKSQVIDNEWVEWYQITTWNSTKSINYYDSGKIYSDTHAAKNEINCRVDMSSLPPSSENKYYLRLDYATTNGYTETRYWTFVIGDYAHDTDITYTKIIDDENGTVSINVTGLNKYNTGYLVIRRASHRTNFTIWELLTAKYVGSISSWTFEDSTLESLTGYRYQIQYMNNDEIYRPVYVEDDDILHCDFYGMLLSDKEKTLRITFDFQVTNRSNAVNRTKVDTLGGRYPMFTQNARLKYHTYTISGRISTEDNGELFLSKSEAMNQEYYNYRYNPETISPHNAQCQGIKPNDDWLYEREYRDAVEDWLNNGKPKLFRSMTEGNIAVMLDNIAMTPDKVLGRRLYDFTATMYEIGDGRDIESLTSLGLYNLIDER